MTSWEPPPGPPAGPPPPPRGFTADEPVPSDFGSAPAPPAWAGRPSPRPLSRLLVFGVLAAMVAAGIGGFAVTRALSDGTDGRAGPPIIEPTGPDTESDDPDAEVLRDLGVQQPDVGSNRSVIIIPDGTDHVDGVTLDLCEGTFPSETLRTARLQVADVDRNSNIALSTEAVLYRDPAALDQAFAELRRTRAACTTEEFLAPPDADWTDVDGVERLAYRFETRDAAGDPAVGASVYLRRGRVFLGVYFTDSEGPQPPVDGRTTVRGIVELMQERLADLPASVVNRGG